MTDDNHTYSAKCRLAPVSRVQREDEVPPVEAQFFYSSVIPIDDPLSTSSTVGADSKTSKGQVRPFSRGDNNALEKAWLSLMSEPSRRAHQDALRNLDRTPQFDPEVLTSLIQLITTNHWERHRKGYKPQDVTAPVSDVLPTMPVPTCCSELVLDVSQELERAFCALVRRRNPALNVDQVTQQVVFALDRLKKQANDEIEAQPVSNSTPSSHPGTASASTTDHPVTHIPKTTTTEPRSSKRRSTIGEMRARTNSLSTSQPPRVQTPVGSPGLTRPPVVDDGISGRPFVRVGSPETQSEPGSLPRTGLGGPGRHTSRNPDHTRGVPEGEETVAIANQGTQAVPEESQTKVAEVAVGISRLHMVSLPVLQMKPIYWSPINDVAIVSRATWFYRLYFQGRLGERITD
ncbi:phosphatidic acid-preferring phospholipase A1 [Fusarium napiforme]|uniref:Phosphatidic acid-preferring phospholipase A1 n=1 Tax=Fusarium napiforme TaxID=42672 RepID=A0A8H5JY84_9HYPO|nr:phosphatidic acid-preferring phospholipase A1 [Fusarium napiforme]